MKTLTDFAPQIRRALDYDPSPHSLADVAEQLRSGKAQAWQEGDGLILTQVLDGGVLNYWIAAGKMADVLALIPRIEAWARERGCTQATMTGRRGWSKVLTGLGWTIEPVLTYSKGL